MPGPWRQLFLDEHEGEELLCYFCALVIAELTDLHVHHRDHDRRNNAPTNLVGAHEECHLRYHGALPPSVHPGPAISAAKMGHAVSQETKDKIREALTGRPVAERDADHYARGVATRRATGKPWANGSEKRRKCGGCDRVSSPAGLSHHQRSTGHEGWVEAGVG